MHNEASFSVFRVPIIPGLQVITKVGTLHILPHVVDCLISVSHSTLTLENTLSICGGGMDSKPMISEVTEIGH